MKNVIDFHPDIQSFIQYFSSPDLSLSQVGERFGVSKQAVQKRIGKVIAHIQCYEASGGPLALQKIKKELDLAKIENQKQAKILAHLRQQMIIKSAIIYLMCNG